MDGISCSADMVLLVLRHGTVDTSCRPTGCRSAAASAPQKLSKSERSRARSGRLHGMLAGGALVYTRLDRGLLRSSE